MASPHTPRQNHLLAALPVEDYANLRPHLELLPLPLDQVFSESWNQLRHVYFPTTAIVCRRYDSANGETPEIMMVGNEGMIGIALFMGGDTTPSRAVVQKAGFGYRLDAHVLQQQFACCGELQRLLLRYMKVLRTSIALTLVCNRHHAPSQRLCRWLLSAFDRIPSGEDLLMTPEAIAGLLGVRRESIAEAAGDLRGAGLITFNRGHIALLDRAGLEARCCECYALVKKEWDRLRPKQCGSLLMPDSCHFTGTSASTHAA